jgi:hypothetical protein
MGSSTDIEDQKRAEKVLEETARDRTASLMTTIGQLEEFSYTSALQARSTEVSAHLPLAVPMKRLVSKPLAIRWFHWVNFPPGVDDLEWAAHLLGRKQRQP